MPGRGGILMAGGVSVVDMFGVFLLEIGHRGGTIGLVDPPPVGMIAVEAEARTMQWSQFGCCCVCANWIDE
jgi:hypothetical protein